MKTTTAADGWAELNRAEAELLPLPCDTHANVRAGFKPAPTLSAADVAEREILTNRASAAALRGAVENRETHITVTIRLSRNSTLYGIRVLLDSMAYALRAKIHAYRDESGHLHFDLTPTTEAAP